MTLSEYFDRERGAQLELSKRLGCSQAHLSKLAKKGRGGATASPYFALAIESGTEGQVKAEEVPLSPTARRQLRVLRNRISSAPSDESARPRKARA